MPDPFHRESDGSIDSSPPNSGLDRSLNKSKRLTRSSLFAETFSGKKKRVGRFMVLWLREADDADFRIGTVSSKKVHLRANRRNFARRRMREAWRHLRPYCSGQADVVFVARRAILSADWNTVISEMLNLIQKAGLISPGNAERARTELEASNGWKLH
ncbi:ribonuclease P protein component [Pontiella agarivorans]|uniref:Ribonuclease P protein component n=1 Tax=Pontiella agarivorans TaxID=3038953 RepID=A0ABU5MUM3_9BACT|nr:ribonuclease P protein component [Pontiella agarivorans]MDZ8117914.1 ribonuclease P protein component [Pontiella agarivorans]